MSELIKVINKSSNQLHKDVDELIKKYTRIATQIMELPPESLKRGYGRMYDVIDEKDVDRKQLLDSLEVATSKLNDVTKMLVSYKEKIDDTKKSINKKIMDNESLDKSARKVVVDELKDRPEDFESLPSDIKAIIDPSRITPYEGNGGKSKSKRPKSKRSKQKRKYTNKRRNKK